MKRKKEKIEIEWHWYEVLPLFAVGVMLGMRVFLDPTTEAVAYIILYGGVFLILRWYKKRQLVLQESQRK